MVKSALLPAAIALAIFAAPVYAQVRMGPIPPERMTDAQKKAVAEFMEARKTTAPLAGPWSVLLRVPELLTLGRQFREHVQFRTVLGDRLTEMVILITARHWTQQYEWNAHQGAALKAGLKPEIVQALAEGRRPDHMADDEAVIYEFCTELERTHGTSDGTYAKMLAKFGENGIVEAASIQGFYAMLAMVMNTARTPLAPGTKPPLTAFPQ